ncbi:hypothetical protein H6F50_09405 [Coleofasciculus sp. FACHB-712]|uniref:hypothetical protein n=1 Tax=Coleofasciculus sp. FACHB-712 TaxID=2692789 RepID=UPI001682BF35|nr:hypothetical protein [Coleofasciculus sp. FACHB-712]MBD1942569.1 hypothetical protein [Coleofasciculus sp. FACHB-712]
MNESNQAPSSSLSLQLLLKELENLVAFESGRNGTPWISMARLTELFHEKHGFSPEQVAINQGYSDSLKSLIKSSGNFSIYSTPISQEFHIALFQAVVPSYKEIQISPIQYRIKRLRKIDRYLLQTLLVQPKVKRVRKVDKALVRTLEAKDAKETPHYQKQKILESHPNLLAEISSENDLEVALIEIIRSLTENNPKKFVTIAVLSNKFCGYYKQPIRAVMRTMCPDMRLIELLQANPSLFVQKVDDGWQVTIETHFID